MGHTNLTRTQNRIFVMFLVFDGRWRWIFWIFTYNKYQILHLPKDKNGDTTARHITHDI